MGRHVLVTGAANGIGAGVCLASQLAHVGGENFAVYAGTKAFVLAFARSLAREVGQHGITVNAVCPGSIVTDMNRPLYPPERQRQCAAELPLRAWANRPMSRRRCCSWRPTPAASSPASASTSMVAQRWPSGDRTRDHNV
jgi:NAD(P)-dependent dehydrogenase (short-subunit alcohol dehydrogenase family)